MSTKRGVGISKLGRPAGIGADDRDSVRGEVEPPREPDRDRDDEQRSGQLRHQDRSPNNVISAVTPTATVAPLTSSISVITSHS